MKTIFNQYEIKGFFEQFRWLSNFHPCTVKFNGETYPSSENAYQAQKFPSDERFPFFTCTPSESKKLGKFANIIPSVWDAYKYDTMHGIVLAKFSQNKDLKQMLLDTGDRYLEESNNWQDCEWGVCRGRGKNLLGKILMDVRTQLNGTH